MTKITKNRVYSDPIRDCKESGGPYTNSARHCDYYPTSGPKGPPDGKFDTEGHGPRRWATPINSAAKPNTYTGSKK
jgi:hypothetical protein